MSYATVARVHGSSTNGLLCQHKPQRYTNRNRGDGVQYHRHPSIDSSRIMSIEQGLSNQIPRAIPYGVSAVAFHAKSVVHVLYAAGRSPQPS